MASREAMNMGSRSSTVISEFRSIISSLGQATDSAFQKLTSGAARVSSAGSGGGQNVSNMLVAPNPVFSSAPAITTLTETGTGLVAGGGAAGTSSSLVARGPTNLSTFAAQTNAATLYQPEVGGGGGGAGGGGGRFSSRGGGAGGGSNPANRDKGIGNIPVLGSLIAGGYAIYNTGADLTPSTSDVLEAQLLQKRASFYAGGGGIGAIQASQQSLAQAAMLSGDNPQMDVLRAQIAAQSYGLGGASASKILTGAANVSNLMPGLGVEGAVRASGAMQQANNVNMLRGIGIQLRGPSGTLKGPDEVIEEVWQKICRDYKQAYGSAKNGGKPTFDEVQISLQPGNALDSMLSTYFGNDPMLKQLVANGLLFKAQGGASFDTENKGIIKSEVQRLGGTTEAMISYTNTAAAGQGFMTAGQGAAETGFVKANALVGDFYSKAKAMADLVLQKALGDTLLTAFGGNPAATIVGVGVGQGIVAPEKLAGLMNLTNPVGMVTSGLGIFGDLLGVGGIMDLLKGAIPFLATGGPVTSGSAYVVGEKGPELFVPDTNGNVVPNDQLKTGGSFTYNFTINAASGNTQDLVSEIKNVLVQLETSRKVSEA